MKKTIIYNTELDIAFNDYDEFEMYLALEMTDSYSGEESLLRLSEEYGEYNIEIELPSKPATNKPYKNLKAKKLEAKYAINIRNLNYRQYQQFNRLFNNANNLRKECGVEPIKQNQFLQILMSYFEKEVK